MNLTPGGNAARWRQELYRVIFEADTRAGKWFDVALIVSIVLSVLVVMLDSSQVYRRDYDRILYFLEWFFTIMFSIEYVARLLCVGSRLRYMSSFFGVVDLLAVLPTYVSLFIPGSQYLMVIRILRVLRIFRVLSLATYIAEAGYLVRALKASRRRIVVFLFTVLTAAVILGSLMYLIEGRSGGFDSIPHSVYWAIVTLTTVGYGDISPQTGLGRVVAATVMILGYSMIVVPTGIVSVELSRAERSSADSLSCRECGRGGHDRDAQHCKYCGSKLPRTV